VRLPNYRDNPPWRWVYLCVLCIVFGALDMLLFGLHAPEGWILIGGGAVFGIRSVVEFRHPVKFDDGE
jgi:hypothetical protein